MTSFRLAVIAAVVGALAVPASSQSRPATVTIMLGSHFYSPNPVRLTAGVPVRLVFRNQARKRHDFTAPGFFQSARIMAGRPPGGQVLLEGGRWGMVTLIPRRGIYRVHCSRFMHSQLGMTGRIIVT